MLAAQLDTLGTTDRLTEAVSFLRSTDLHLLELQKDEKSAKLKRVAEVARLKKQKPKDGRQAKRLAQTAVDAEKAFRVISINWENEWNSHMESVEAEMEEVNSIIAEEGKLAGSRIFKN